MRKIIILLLCGVILTPNSRLQSEDPGQITGTVFMPTVKRERRSFRGRIYRNRLSSANKSREVSTALQSSFIDIIISAYPLTFEPVLEPIDDVLILQRNAKFLPRVVPITPGTVIKFINKDRFFHNVFSITPGAKFNIGRKPTGKIVSRRIYKLGEVKLFCDIHAQMNGTIICLNTPYFTRVEPNGKFSLQGLPAGTYELRVYHPDLNDIIEVVEIREGQTLKKTFSLSK